MTAVLTTGQGKESSSTAAALFRLRPYLTEARTPLLLSGAAVLCSMLCGLTIPLLIGRIVDGPVASGDTAELPWLILAVVVLGCAEAALFFTRRLLIARPTTRVEARLRADLYAHLQRLPVAFHDRWQSGQLLSRAVSDLATIRRFLAFVGIFLVVNSTVLLIGLGVLFALSPLLGLVMLGASMPLVAFSTMFEKHYTVAARRAQDQVGDLATTVEESVQGIRVLKAFGRGRWMSTRFAAQAGRLRDTELRKVRIMAALWAAIIALPELGIGGQLAVGAVQVAGGDMTIGTLVAGVTVGTFLLWPTASIGWLLAETSNAASACRRYWEVRDALVTVDDPPRPTRLRTPVRGNVKFRGVRFGYPGSDTEVLRGVDLELRPGETLAIVGATGSGKTTLTALVSRLADVTGGRITLDGVDIRELRLAELRSVVATAFSDPVLFSASVRENVALGPGERTESEVRQALEVASATGFVDALPWGTATRIGEQGLSLSGGQRQRLALARAVAARPALLVLDDPLSALDVHTEAEVEHALRRVLTGVTALMVAHRASTVQLADRVALLSGGRITAIGEHSTLLATNAEYRGLLSSERVVAESGSCTA